MDEKDNDEMFMTRKRKDGYDENAEQPAATQKLKTKNSCLQLSTLTDDDWKCIMPKLFEHIDVSNDIAKCDTLKDTSKTKIRHKGKDYSIKRLLFYFYHQGIHDECRIQSICEDQNKNCVDKRHLYEFASVSLPWSIRKEYILKAIKGNCNIKDDQSCWLWKGEIDLDGYGKTGFSGVKDRLVHRLVYKIINGEDSIPENHQLLHDHGPNGRCDGRNCCNNTHLKPGTSQDNSNDMKDMGTVAKGATHHNTKMSEEVAQKIKDSKGDGRTQNQRAVDYEVSKATVQAIDRNQTWTDLLRQGQTTDRTRREKDNARATERRTKRKIDGFTIDEYEGCMDNIFKYVTMTSCDRLIDHKDNEHIYPCLLLARDKRGKAARASIGGISKAAHIYVWEYYFNNCQPTLDTDEKGNKLIIRHLCLPRPDSKCVEDTHLKLGTVAENNRDKLFWATDKRLKLNMEKANEMP